MLPAAARMRASREFGATVRGGVRVARPSVVVHASSAGDQQRRVGFVISKKVGNAVTRNRVKRQLRHLVRVHLDEAPPGTRVVVRALPAAALASADLSGDLAGAWQSGLRKLEGRR